jgi:DNA repair exonuclease SbcCD ATPase subunit
MPSVDFKAFEVIQGFKSFDAAQAFSFDDLKGGFYFVTGENQLEPSLGANGAGKSTLWDALCWVLFEKTPTKLKAGDIHCWGSKRKTIVSLRFEVDGTGYLLTRTWNPNKVCLSEEGEPAKVITNEDIVALIGFDFEAFLYSVLISQFSSKFFDLKPSEKMEVFSSVMESTLACWLGFSDKAKDKRGKLEASISESQHRIANLEGQIVSLEGQDYSEQIEEWERVKRIALAEIERDIKEAEAAIKDFKVKAKEYAKSIDKSEKKIASCNEKGIALKNELADIRNEEREAADIKIELNTEASTLRSSISKFKGLKGECPTCLQEIDGATLEKEIRRLNKELSKVEADSKKVDEVRDELLEDINERDEALDTLRDKVKGLQRELNKEESTEEKVGDRIEDLEDDIDSFSEKYDKKMEEENPYEKLESDKKAKIKKVTDNKDEQEVILLSQESDYQVYNYWVTGFKDIRYMILSEALHELEIQINSSLARLGLCDWEILLSVDKVNKSKTVTKGFTVLIKSPTNDELVPFEAWSGGEGQRLRLAGTLGMIDFISGRMGFTTNIEVYDEPTKFIGGSGIEDLITVLGSRAASSGKKVFMIDHKNLETFGEFDGSIKVVKDEDGSRIEIEEEQ